MVCTSNDRQSIKSSKESEEKEARAQKRQKRKRNKGRRSDWGSSKTIVTHEAAGMAIVEDPADSFSHSIAGIEDTRDVKKKNVTGRFPILNCKAADVNVARAFGRDAGIDHFHTGFIILHGG
jgi:hypothetical protein